MARLALQVPVFIASPSDAVRERDAAERIIRTRGVAASHRGVFLCPVRWEKDSRPGLGRPQALINKLLKSSELIVVVFRERFGTPAGGAANDPGAWEELEQAMEFVRSGKADDVFLYCRRELVDGETKDEGPLQRRLKELFQSRRIFAWPYKDEVDFARQFEAHLDLWLETWVRLPEICEVTLMTATPTPRALVGRGEDRLVVLSPLLKALDERLVHELSDIAISLYQEVGPRGLERSLPELLRPLLNGRQHEASAPAHALLRRIGVASVPQSPVWEGPDRQLRFSDEEWFYLFCALGLVGAIRGDRLTAVERHPYVNPVHQLLASLAEAHRAEVVAVLRRWLADPTHEASRKPIVRNFAAYVLGMLHADEAQDDLARALGDPGKDVALYAVTSLGKLRCRRHLDSLAHLFGKTTDPQFRLTIGQAICRIIGVAEYEL